MHLQAYELELDGSSDGLVQVAEVGVSAVQRGRDATDAQSALVVVKANMQTIFDPDLHLDGRVLQRNYNPN